MRIAEIFGTGGDWYHDKKYRRRRHKYHGNHHKYHSGHHKNRWYRHWDKC